MQRSRERICPRVRPLHHKRFPTTPRLPEEDLPSGPTRTNDVKVLMDYRPPSSGSLPGAAKLDKGLRVPLEADALKYSKDHPEFFVAGMSNPAATRSAIQPSPAPPGVRQSSNLIERFVDRSGPQTPGALIVARFALPRPAPKAFVRLGIIGSLGFPCHPGLSKRRASTA